MEVLKQRKILLGITKATWGGAQQYVYQLAASLPQDRFQVSVIGGETGLLSKRLGEIGIPFRLIPGVERDLRWFGEVKALVNLYKTIRANRPEILHLNSPKMAGLGAFVGRVLGIPKIVVTIHGWTFREERSLPERLAIRFFSWLTAIFADAIITITGADYETALKFPLIPQRKIRLIPIGADSASYRFKTKEEARKILIDIIQKRCPGRNLETLSNKTWIGANGELHRNKDYPTLIRAIAMLPGTIPLLIISSGEEEAALDRLIEELGLSNRIFLTGFIPEAAHLISAFSIFAMSSVKEGLPYVILEAGLAQLPVAATRVGGIPDVIEHESSGILVPPRDPGALARAIGFLAAHPEIARSYGRNLRRSVETKFAKDTMVAATIICYQ